MHAPLRTFQNNRAMQSNEYAEGDLMLGKVLARRVFSRPMDAHFWKKHKENSPNLLYVYGKT